MNAMRRKELKKAIEFLEQAQNALSWANEIIAEVRDEEEESYDNMPEGLQESERGQKLEENMDLLDEILGNIEDIDIDEMISTMLDL